MPINVLALHAFPSISYTQLHIYQFYWIVHYIVFAMPSLLKNIIKLNYLLIICLLEVKSNSKKIICIAIYTYTHKKTCRKLILSHLFLLIMFPNPMSVLEYDCPYSSYQPQSLQPCTMRCRTSTCHLIYMVLHLSVFITTLWQYQ